MDHRITFLLDNIITEESMKNIFILITENEKFNNEKQYFYFPKIEENKKQKIKYFLIYFNDNILLYFRKYTKIYSSNHLINNNINNIKKTIYKNIQKDIEAYLNENDKETCTVDYLYYSIWNNIFKYFRMDKINIDNNNYICSYEIQNKYDIKIDISNIEFIFEIL